MPRRKNPSAAVPRQQPGYWQRFVAASSIHGVQYLSRKESGNSVFRLAWLVLIVTLFLMAVYTINNAVVSWRQTPTVTAVNFLDVRRTETPFPDVTISPGSTVEWREIFTCIDRADTQNEVFKLFAASPALGAIVEDAVASAAMFQLYRDFTDEFEGKLHQGDVVKARMMLDRLCGAAAASDEGHQNLLRISEGLLVANGTTDLVRKQSKKDALGKTSFGDTFLNISYLQANNSLCQRETTLSTGRQLMLPLALPLAKEVFLYRSLSRQDLLVLLLRLVTMGEDGLKQDFPDLSERDMKNIYSYITKMLKRVNLFPKLPWPLLLSFTLVLRHGGDGISISKVLSDESSVFNTNNIYNYGDGEFNATYKQLATCIQNQDKTPDTSCDHLDDLFRQSFNEARELFLFGYHHSSFAKSNSSLFSPPLVPVCMWKKKDQGRFSSAGFTGCESVNNPEAIMQSANTFYSSTNNRDRVSSLDQIAGLELVIDRSIGETSKGRPGENAAQVWVHGQNSFADVLMLDSTDIYAPPGQVTTVSVEPIVFDSTDGFGRLPFDVRNCSIPREAKSHRLRMFPSYSRMNCFLDYGMTRINDVCNCTAFLLTGRNQTDMEYCGISKHLCYGNYLESLVIQPAQSGAYDGECPSLCNYVYYTASVQSTVPIEKVLKMEDSTVVKKKSLYRYMFHWEHQNYMSYAIIGNGSSDRSVMRERLSKVSVLRVNFGKAFVQKLTTDAKVNFSDKLSTVGGTLGLFTGFSIVSIAEIVHWVMRALLHGRNG